MSDKPIIRHYISYLLPGAFLPEVTVREISERNPLRDAQSAPPGAYAFEYYDIIEAVVDIQGKRTSTRSDKCGKSKMYYINARLYTADQVAALPGDYQILLDNMRGNGWTHVVRCLTGNWQPYEPMKHELIFTD